MDLSRKTRRSVSTNHFQSRSRKVANRRMLSNERLESRSLLAADIVFTPGVGLISINGSDQSDNAIVRIHESLVEVSVESEGQLVSESFEQASVAAIFFDGHGGDDQFENMTSIGSTANGGSGHDILTGGNGIDRLFGGDGRDVLRGGTGNDLLEGNGGADLLLGESGDDSLIGNSGRDILIGGSDLDELDGGSWSDIIIGGTTSYDADTSTLLKIQRDWRSDRGYSARVDRIGERSAPLILHQTVLDDGDPDQLKGGSDTDWIFVTGEFKHHHMDNHLNFLATLDNVRDVNSNETVSSVLPHARDSSMRNEHFALLGLVSSVNATHTAVQSGAWTDPQTWADGIVPESNSNVVIAENVQVNVDGEIEDRLHAIRVNGELSFATDRDTELKVDTLVVSPEGVFEMGTEEDPIEANVTARLLIVDNGQIDRTWDPFELSRGVIVHGHTSVVGAEKTPFVKLAKPAMRRDTMLALAEAPSNWDVGDKLVLAGTDRMGQQNEELTIASVHGSRIELTSPLRYNHDAPRDGLAAHVANLTRNAIFESENTGDVRGHLMFMHNKSAHVSYAGIYDLGRTDKSIPANDTVFDHDFNIQSETGMNQRGRYGMHFHRSGVTHGGHAATVHGTVLTGSRGWGYVNHSSHVDFTSNVSYDVTGAGFVTEAGDEIGSFDGNLAIFSRGSGESTEERNDIEDFGHQGNGFWFQGGGVSVTNNAAAGHAEDGFIFFTRGLREGRDTRLRFPSVNLLDDSIANGKTTLSVGEVPFREFRNNESYANETGVATRFHKLGGSHDEVSLIEDLTLWNNRRGLHLPYTNRVIVRNVEVIGTTESPRGYGITRNSVTRNITYENISVEGYEYGLQIPLRGQIEVVSGRLNNIENIVIGTTRRVREVNIHENVEFETPTNLRGKTHLDIALRANFEPHNESVEHVFLDDKITLHRAGSSRELFFHEQTADFMPFPDQLEFVPNALLGKTNQQLFDEYGKAIGGRLAPDHVVTIDEVFGLIEPFAGDVNRDGRFDSSDLISVFQAGEFEDDVAGNSTWIEGDWSGDGDFTTSDLVLAFQHGLYKA